MQHRSTGYACKYCPEGMVRFFTSFRDANGTVHFARKVFAVCSNDDCPGRGQGDAPE